MANKMIGYQERETYRGASEVIIYGRFAFDPRAELAKELVKHFGVIAGVTDGEDSAGRQKIRMQESAELVERACNISDLMFAQFEARGWSLALPEPKLEEKAAPVRA